MIVKFTADENFYLPNFDETVLLNTKDKYLGYLIGKAVHEYVTAGTTSIPTLHTLDSIFNYAPERIERIFPLLDADDHSLRSTMRVVLPERVLADEVVASLADTEGIVYIEKEPLYTVSANDSLLGSQRYITKTESDKARNAGAEGDASVVIAVIDNGFEITHPDLAANILPGRDAADNDSDPTPPSSRYSNTFAGHGTHTAGLAAAVTDNGAGI